MWIIQFLPDWVFHTLLALGLLGTIAGFLAGKIPVIKQYALLLKIAGPSVLALAILLEGALIDNKVWQQRVLEVEAKLAKAEQESKEANLKLEKKAETKVQVIRQKGTIVKQYIDREVTKYDASCKIPEAVIKAHNAAARNEELK